MDCKAITRTTSGNFQSERGYLCGFIISSDGDNKITLYDNTAGSGTVLGEAFTTATIPYNSPIMFPIPVRFSTGCYGIKSGAGAMSVTAYIAN